MTGRRATDWLTFTPKRDDDARGPDRRAHDRRAPRRKVDPLFAATLLNQIVPADTTFASMPYRAEPAPLRPGIVTNLRA